MECYLGIDLGTTGLKSVLADTAGNIIGDEYRSYPLNVPKIGYAEQHPEAWYQQMCSAISGLLKKTRVKAADVKCVGLSGQMHGLVVIGKNKDLLRSAIIHCDGRASRQKQEILQRISMKELGSYVQNQPHSGFQALSLMWMRKNQPALFEKIRHVLLPKDFLRFRLTDNLATEVTDAGGTLMFDNINLRWSNEVLSLTGIDPEILPDARHYPYEIAGFITKKASEDTGLMEGTPVSYGGGDQAMQAVGNGLLNPGNASVNLGTSGQVFTATASPVYDPLLRTHTFCHAQQSTWYVMGAVLNACLAFNWFIKDILGSSDYGKADEMASQVAPGADGLIFMPYLTGERTPHMNEQARAAFIGLTLSHGRAHMVRAVLEGVAYSLLDALEVLREMSIPIGKMIVSGGGAKSSLWRQILADIFETPLYISKTKEQAAMGAILCAQVACERYSTLKKACETTIEYEPYPISPDEKNFQAYHSAFSAFHQSHEQNKFLFK